MLIKNVRIENAKSESDVRIEKGIIHEIGEHLELLEGKDVIGGEGGLALPPFVGCHVHLDTCY